MKKVIILGSTGSIGESTLDVIRQFKDRFQVEALSVNGNIDKLEQQINEFNPRCVVVNDHEKAKELSNRIGNKCEVLAGSQAIEKVALEMDYNVMVTALVGFAGLAPTIAGIKRGKRIALANKETLVVAGELIIELCQKHDAEIIPVDSEHSAIFQSMVGEENKSIRKIILTASGGPFLKKTKEELKNVSLKEALNHPNWDMGSKITIDSATMMNKGLEVIEAKWLFNLPDDMIEVIVHPQSIIHSMVEFNDRSVKAQLSLPDMKLPIQYALTFPERFESSFVENDFRKISQLTFLEPDLDKYECLKLAYEVMQIGGTAPCILNAANEIAVSKFLREEIGFIEIPNLIKGALDKIENHSTPKMETIFDCDRQTREYISKL